MADEPLGPGVSIPGLGAADAPGAVLAPATPAAQAPAPTGGPPPGSPSIKLSDGSYLRIHPDATPEAVVKAKQSAEDFIDRENVKKAADINGPYATVDKVYSATRAYPNNAVGHAMAWLDHNLYGNELNRAVADPLNAATGDAGPAAMRMGTTALTWAPDLAASGVNVGKHLIAPGMGTRGDVPVLGPSFRAAIGSPELSHDAPFWQAALEAAGGGASAGAARIGANASGQAANVAKNVLFGTTGTAGAEAGEAIGGEPGSFVGGLLGGGGLGLGRIAAKGVAATAAHPNAPEILAAGRRMGEASGQPDFLPSFRSLANPTWQRVSNAFGSIPWFGSRIEHANEDTSNMIQGTRDRVAAQIAGPGGIAPEGASTGSIGTEIQQGAQATIPQIKARQQAEWGPLNAGMADNPVGIADILSNMNRSLTQRPTTIANENAIRAAVDQIASRAPGGAHYTGPDVPLPPSPEQMTVPWSVAKDFRSGLGYELNRGEVQVPGERIADIKGDTTDAMRTASQQAGFGNTFDVARENYARMKPVLEWLQGLGGEQVGNRFTNVPPEATSARALTGNTQSPTSIEPLTNPNTFSPPHWQRAVGQWLSTLGNAKQGAFRPELYADAVSPKKVTPDVLQQMTQDPTGTPTQHGADLQDARTVAENYSTPMSRHGLIGSLGAGEAVRSGLHKLAAFGAGAMGTGLVLPALGAYGVARALESATMKRAMGGDPLGWVTPTLPTASAVTTQEAGRRSPFQVKSPHADMFRQLYTPPPPQHTPLIVPVAPRRP